MESKTPIREVVYTAESTLRRPSQLIKTMVGDLLASRELAWRLLSRNLNVRYRRSALGPLWVLMPPLSLAIIFTFLRGAGVVTFRDTNIPYPVFVVLGVVLWQLFITSINLPLRAMKSAQSLIRTIRLPIEALILAQVGETLFDLAFQLAVVGVMMIIFKVAPTFYILLAPIPILILFALGLGMGLLLVPLGTLYSDVSTGIPIVTRFWFFLTPVLYPPPTEWPYVLLTDFNPVTPPLVAARSLITEGRLHNPGAFAIVAVLSVALLLFGWLVYRLSVPILVER